MTPDQNRQEETGKVHRKLAAIFAADVAGYSRLMAADEEGTTRRLRDYRTITDAIIAHRGGRIANTAGDSVLAEFESSVEAVRAAVEIQESLLSKNERLPDDRRLQFRIGINVGDVILQGSDLLGDGINVAARLEALAEPGGICISGEVRDQIDGKLTLQCLSIGKQRLKNIRRPVQAYKVAGGASGARGASGFPALRSENSIWRGVAGAMALAVIGAVAWIGFERLRSGTGIPQAPVSTPIGSTEVTGDPASAAGTAARNIVKRASFGGHDYALVGTWGIKWDEAEAAARAMGGYLAAIGSAEENAFIVDMIRDEDSVWRRRDEGARWQKFGPWIGLVQLETAQEPAGGWVWSNGEPLTYTDWFWHQPDNYDGVEHFGRYRVFSDQSQIQWDDARASATAKGYVVEFDPN